MDKVYIVTSGTYSDYGIDQVFAGKEVAEAYAAHKNANGRGCDNDYRVEEYDLFSGDSISLMEWFRKKREEEEKDKIERERKASIEYPLYRFIISWEDGQARKEELIVNNVKGSAPKTRGWHVVKKSPNFITDNKGFAGPRSVYGLRFFRSAQEEWLNNLDESVLVQGLRKWSATGEGPSEELAKAIAYEHATMAQAEYEELT